ncbi:MAG: CBS domain-containing protein [Patescibacteria group bacterium]
MIVRNIMEKNVITIKASTTYYDAAKILYGNKISGAPVVDDDNKLIGMLSEKDLFKVLYPFYKSYYDHPELYLDSENREGKANDIKDHKIETFMSKGNDIITVEPATPIMRAGALMIAKHVHRLPVVEKGKLIGIVSREDIFRAILQRNFDL